MATARVLRHPEVAPRRVPGDRSRHLRVVRGPARRIGLSPRAGVVLTVLAFVALFAVAVCHTLLIERQAAIDELDAQVAEEQARYEELSLEVAELKSPARIEAEAAERGMVPAGETVWLTPDEPAPPVEEPAEETEESPDTSAARVKPYIEATP
jgi:cell division protein FtsL